MNMFTEEDTKFIILASIRYAIGRKTYIPALICNWIKKHWPELSYICKDMIIKEVKEVIDKYERLGDSNILGDSINKKTWYSFYNWINDNFKNSKKPLTLFEHRWEVEIRETYGKYIMIAKLYYTEIVFCIINFDYKYSSIKTAKAAWKRTSSKFGIDKYTYS